MAHSDEHHRAPLLWLLGPYLTGLLAAQVGLVPGAAAAVAMAGAVLLGCGSVLLAGVRRRGAVPGWAVGLTLAAFIAGMVQMQVALAEQPRWRDLPPREAVLEVELTRVFSQAQVLTSGRRSCLAHVVAAPPLIDDVRGQRLFLAFAPPESIAAEGPVRTMRLTVRGVLTPLRPAGPMDDGFDAFLWKTGVRFRLDRAAATAVTRPPTAMAGFWHGLGRRFETILERGLPEGHPAAGAYLAMFLGRKSELSDAQKQGFLRSGTMHLFAISGLHVGMIAGCLFSLFALLRLPRRACAIVSLVALWMFVEATGGSPSARRAFLMVACLSAGRLLQRPANSLAALTTAACLVLFLDPLAALSTSFQLSYSVVATILLYGVPLSHRWLEHWRPFVRLPVGEWNWRHRAIEWLGRQAISLASISVSATLISTPLGIAYFGLASPGAVLANMVLVPIAGLAITAGFASLVTGLLGAGPASHLFNHAGALVLSVVDAGAQSAATVPGMYFHGHFTQAWMTPAVMAGLLGVMIAGYSLRWRHRLGSLWWPPLALIGALVLLVTPGERPEQSAAMKSAYELAMERLRQADPEAGPTLTDEQKARLAEIDRIYQGRVAEREIFLKQRLSEALATGQAQDAEKIRIQIVDERARLEEDREAEKNKVRRATGTA